MKAIFFSKKKGYKTLPTASDSTESRTNTYSSNEVQLSSGWPDNDRIELRPWRETRRYG